MAATNSSSRKPSPTPERSDAGVGMSHPTVVPRNFRPDATGTDEE